MRYTQLQPYDSGIDSVVWKTNEVLAQAGSERKCYSDIVDVVKLNIGTDVSANIEQADILVDTREGSLIPPDPTRKIYVRSRIPLDPVTKILLR